MKPEADVFISYSSEDADRVRILVTALEAEGWNVFWDQEILPGEEWESYIGIHLDAAPVVIAVWSKFSVKSRYVRSEVNRANRRSVLVPVAIDAVEPPFGLEHIQSANLVEWLANGGGALPARLKSAVLRRISLFAAKGATPNVGKSAASPASEAASDHPVHSVSESKHTAGEDRFQALEAIANSLARREVIDAIKRYRDATGCGLKAAKDFIEGLREGRLGDAVRIHQSASKGSQAQSERFVLELSKLMRRAPG